VLFVTIVKRWKGLEEMEAKAKAFDAGV